MNSMENIASHRTQPVRRFHQARWDEPVIFELSQPGERGILVPEVEPGIAQAAGQPLAGLPSSMLRQRPPALPEMSQNRVLRHYLRLSQETLGADLNVDVGQGTCTMKYNPKINDQLARQPGMSELHPRQPDSTVQGMLEVMDKLEGVMREVSGMDAVSLQPRGGSQAIFANMSMVRAWHESRGEGTQRDEVITTIFSHPSDAACAKLVGYKVITIYPDADGYPDLAALKAAVSPRTAALVITNPEDTGIFNTRIREFVDAVHAVGGLCVYDQANANGLLGIARAREAGFDLCHLNLHKTFATPHACGGPAVGAVCCTSELAPFLPGPLLRQRDGGYRLVKGGEQSIGKISSFAGTASIMLRAYAWIMNLGGEGLRTVSEIAVLNNNYMMHELLKIDGMAAPYAAGKRRIEQVRYSWSGLTEATGVTSEEIGLRAADFGVHYWTSHHPYVVPQPATIEPTESYSRADLDEFIGVMRHIAGEARSNPDLVKTAPHNCPVHRVQGETLDDPERWAITWRAYQRKLGERGLA